MMKGWGVGTYDFRLIVTLAYPDPVLNAGSSLSPSCLALLMYISSLVRS